MFLLLLLVLGLSRQRRPEVDLVVAPLLHLVHVDLREGAGVVVLPVHHHSAHQHEKEHQGRCHPLKLVVYCEMRVEIEEFGEQKNYVGCFLDSPVRNYEEHQP